MLTLQQASSVRSCLLSAAAAAVVAAVFAHAQDSEWTSNRPMASLPAAVGTIAAFAASSVAAAVVVAVGWPV